MRMRVRVVFAVIVVVALGAAACGSGSTPRAGSTEAKSSLVRISATLDDATRATDVVNGLGLDLLHSNVGSAKGNVALSPWSIATALTMARHGARGTTASEMDRVLHIVDPAAVDQAMNGLEQQLASRNGTFPGNDTPLVVELSAANRLFAQVDTRFASEFLDALAANYGAGVGLVDYKTATEAARVAINAWVAGQTHDRITELLARDALDDLTRLVLVNAVYLHADWQVPFAKDQTHDGPFHAPGGDVSVPLMHRNTERGYANGDGWQAVELPYAGGQLAMTVLVPDEGRFDEVVSHLDSALLRAATNTRTVQVDLTLPKFDIAGSLSLKAPLSALGMPTAFTDRADFTGITTDEPLLIRDVVHQANITVDEQGTVAAAATAVIFEATAAPAEQRQLLVDRPFVFLLRDVPTGALLFAGQVTNPAAH